MFRTQGSEMVFINESRTVGGVAIAEQSGVGAPGPQSSERGVEFLNYFSFEGSFDRVIWENKIRLSVFCQYDFVCVLVTFLGVNFQTMNG